MIRDAILALREELGPVKLMAVSKTRTLEEVGSAFAAGQLLFGENHVQEIVSKFDPALNPFAGEVSCEMIGHLQRNKVRSAVQFCSRIDSVDSLELARRIDSEAAKAGKTMPVLMELNTSGESAKTGFQSQEEAMIAIQAISQLKNLRLEGFLTVGPVLCQVGTPLWEKLTRQSFIELRNFMEKAKAAFPSLPLSELSMGMTHDYRIAAEEGSTMVRIGTAIFGERDYN